MPLEVDVFRLNLVFGTYVYACGRCALCPCTLFAINILIDNSAYHILQR